MKVHIDTSLVKAALARLPEKRNAVLKTAAMAANRAATHARAQMVKMGREEYTMKAGDLRGRINIEKANMRWINAAVTVSGKPLPLINFTYKGSGGGTLKGSHVLTRRGERRLRSMFPPVQVQIKRGSWHTLPKAFVAKGGYGEDIFIRKGKQRLPLKALRGPSVAGIVRDTANMQKITTSTAEKFSTEFLRGLQFALGKGRLVGGVE